MLEISTLIMALKAALSNIQTSLHTNSISTNCNVLASILILEIGAIFLIVFFSLDHFAFLQVKDEVSQVVDMIHGILIVCGVA